MPPPKPTPDLQRVLAGLVQAAYVLDRYGQWQAAQACRQAHQLLTDQTKPKE